MTTIENVTNAQIRSLRDEAYAHGDHVMGAIADIALTGEMPAGVEFGSWEKSPAGMTQEAARVYCVRVIAEAEAERA